MSSRSHCRWGRLRYEALGSATSANMGHNMNDRTVSFTSTLAAGLWIIGALMVGFDMVTDFERLGRVGLMVAMGGATITVRSWMCRMAHREQNAFEVGRDVGRAAVHPLR